jgi:hypothetical protein
MGAKLSKAGGTEGHKHTYAHAHTHTHTHTHMGKLTVVFPNTAHAYKNFFFPQNKTGNMFRPMKPSSRLYQEH